MAENESSGTPSEELDDAIADATSDTLKLPDEAEAEPASTEGSQATTAPKP